MSSQLDTRATLGTSVGLRKILVVRGRRGTRVFVPSSIKFNQVLYFSAFVLFRLFRVLQQVNIMNIIRMLLSLPSFGASFSFMALRSAVFNPHIFSNYGSVTASSGATKDRPILAKFRISGKQSRQEKSRFRPRFDQVNKG